MTNYHFCGVAVAASLLLSACVQHKAPAPAFQSYAEDARGICFAERRELEHQGARFDTSFKSPPRSLGQTISVATDYLTDLLNGKRSLAEILDSAIDDLERENLWVGWTTDAFDRLMTCRRAHTRAIQANLRTDRIDRATAEVRIAALQVGLEDDIERFRQFADQIALNTATYAEIYNDIALNTQAETIVIAPVPSTRPTRRTSRPGRTAPTVRLVAPDQSSLPPPRLAVANLKEQLLTNARKRDGIFQRIRAAEATSATLDLAVGGALRNQIA